MLMVNLLSEYDELRNKKTTEIELLVIKLEAVSEIPAMYKLYNVMFVPPLNVDLIF